MTTVKSKKRERAVKSTPFKPKTFVFSARLPCFLIDEYNPESRLTRDYLTEMVQRASSRLISKHRLKDKK